MIKTNFYGDFSSFGIGGGAWAGRNGGQGRPPLYLGTSNRPLSTPQSGRFIDTFSNEIRTLNKRQLLLDAKIAKSEKEEPSEEQKIAMKQEYTLIENGRKYLSLIAQAMQQSMQSIVANFR